VLICVEESMFTLEYYLESVLAKCIYGEIFKQGPNQVDNSSKVSSISCSGFFTVPKVVPASIVTTIV